MKVLRQTMWSPDLTPTTTIMRDVDLNVSIEEAIFDQPGVFATHDIFEIDDKADIVEATAEATRRFTDRFDVEKNMALLYHYDVEMFSWLNEGGQLLMTERAPLNKAQILAVFEQLKKHPGNKNYRFRGVTNTGEVVTA